MKFPDRGSLSGLFMGSVATVILFLAYVMFPLVGMLPGLFAPFPALYYSLKTNRFIGAGIVAVATVVVAVVFDPTAALLFIFQCGIIAVALPTLLMSGRKGARSLAGAVGIAAVSILLLAGIYVFSTGINLHSQILKGIQGSAAQTAVLYEKAGVKGEELKVLKDGMAQAGLLIGKVYPALVVILLAVIAGLNLLALRKFAARIPRFPALGDFARFSNPEHLVWVLIVSGFSMLVENRLIGTIALNILIVTVSLYFMQGLAVIVHFFRKFSVARLARILFYLLLAMQPYLAVIIAALGIFDIWGHFRIPKKQENL